jgi:hypothetical protein
MGLKQVIAHVTHRLAPRTSDSLRELALVRNQGGPLAEQLASMHGRLAELETQNAELRSEIYELRSHSLRVAELTDFVLTSVGRGTANPPSTL